MRVLQVSNFYPPYWVGGYEQLAAWVAEGLRERGHEVEVLTGRGPGFEADPQVRGELDLDIGSLWKDYFGADMAERDGLAGAFRRHVFSRANLAASRRAIDRFRPDLLSFWNPAFITFSPLVAARLAGVPAVVHLHDIAVNAFRNPHPPAVPPSFRSLARIAVDLAIRLGRPARFVVPSAFLRDRFVAREGLPAARTEVLHGVVQPRISRMTAPERRPSPATRLLFVGSLIPEKGPHVLVAAFRKAVAARPELTLTLVGGGRDAYLAELREAALGLPVSFRGRLDIDGVVEACRSHDVLVFPSVWDEPFSFVPLEAMALGLSVIGTTAGGTPEAVHHERTGLLVPPADTGALSGAILRLADHPDLARSLAAAGERWVRETMGFPVFMDRLEALYRDVSGSR